jgi:hypothetical protein
MRTDSIRCPVNPVIRSALLMSKRRDPNELVQLLIKEVEREPLENMLAKVVFL